VVLYCCIEYATIHSGCFSARPPLDEKLFERDLQAALQLSKQSAEDDEDVKSGWSSVGISLDSATSCPKSIRLISL